jgi:hypothetical protein
MFVAAVTAILIAPIRLMQRPHAAWGAPLFLAYVGVLSFTAAFYGVRVLKQKKRARPHDGLPELFLPSLLLAATVGMILFGLFGGFRLALYFAPVGILVALPQLRTLRSVPTGKNWWLLEHLGAMLASSIATVTAFLVVNAGRFFHAPRSPLVWLGPTVVGAPLIVYWRKLYPAGRGKTSPSVALD